MVQETKALSMKQTPPSSTALRVSELPQNTPTPFNLRPETAVLKEIATEMDLLGLRKLSFEGQVHGEGQNDWRLNAKLGATVIQPCAVTLDPVTTRIDIPITRHFKHDFINVDAPEAEMPEDDTVEALGYWIDPGEIMIESLVLHLPLYPRAPGAALGEMVVTEPGLTPMRDEDTRPFAGLAALKDKLSTPDESDEEGQH
ncbi:MAG: DUF177 domain-containing protein [Roseobacter sp.]